MSWTSSETNFGVDYYQQRKGNPNPSIVYQGMPCAPPAIKNLSNNYFFLNEFEEEAWKKQKKLDQDFINKFTSDVQKKKEKAPKCCIKIFEAKNLLLEIISLKNKLQNDAFIIDVNKESFDSHWNAISEQMNCINEKITKFEVISGPLKKIISKKLKIRKARKKRKLKWKAVREQIKKNINEKHKVIDKIISDRNDEVETIKIEAALKRQADTVLHEVRKKKYEATKMLNLLSSLVKLRELRISQEEKNGGYCSKQLTDVFNEVIKRFQILWEKQLDAYKLEEKGLKIMLEENALPHMKESKFEINLLHWEKALFGDVSNDENEKLLTSADNNIEALLKVRRDWDQFLAVEPTAVSSSIPPGWVLPPETSNEDWKQYLAKTKTDL